MSVGFVDYCILVFFYNMLWFFWLYYLGNWYSCVKFGMKFKRGGREIVFSDFLGCFRDSLLGRVIERGVLGGGSN